MIVPVFKKDARLEQDHATPTPEAKGGEGTYEGRLHRAADTGIRSRYTIKPL